MRMNLVWVCLAPFVAFEMAQGILSCAGAEAVPYNNTANVPAGLGNRAPMTGTNAQLSALKLQAALLKELAQEHSERAAEAAASNQVERSKWEKALADELQERSARLLKVMDQMNNPAAGSQKSQTAPVASANNDTNATTDEEIAFLAKLDDELLRLGQELNSAFEQTRANTMQLATNNLPEDFQRIVHLEEENQRYIRSLQKEQFGLELKRLEYRAIRRSLKK